MGHLSVVRTTVIWQDSRGAAPPREHARYRGHFLRAGCVREFRRAISTGLLMTPSTADAATMPESKAKIMNKMNHWIALHEAQQVDPRHPADARHRRQHPKRTRQLLFVAGGKLCTRPTEASAGVTRATVFQLAEELDPVVEGDFTPYDVYVADEAFVAGTSPTLLPVKSLNGKSIGNALPGPTTMRLIKAWNKMVGIDYVGQALAHLKDSDKQRALGEWAQLKDR